MAPELSLVIPTFEGRRTLPAVLRGLAGQEGAPPFEVVVVDDGSKDPPSAWLGSGGDGLDLRLLTQENQGPAAARNAGVDAARAPVVVLLGDDTVPTPGWLAAHQRARTERPEHEPLAVVGHTSLHPRIRQTAFVRWLYREGWQFGYELFDDHEDMPFNTFYSSNVSLPRRALLEEPFDTAFPNAAWEDTELGYRLTRGGMRIVYEKSAHLLHDHPTSLRLFCRRQELVGHGAVVFYRRHPELGGFLGLSPEGPPPRPALAGHLKRTLGARLLEPFPVELPLPWNEILRYYYIRGLERGWRELGGTAS